MADVVVGEGPASASQELTIEEAEREMAKMFRHFSRLATSNEEATPYGQKQAAVGAAVSLEHWLTLKGKPGQIIRVVEGEPEREAVLELAQKLSALRAPKAANG